MRLLAAKRGLIDQHLDEYQRKMIKAEAKGDVDAVANFRRLVRIAEHDRQSVEVLIDKLCRRFNRLVPGDALAASPRGRLAPRRPAAGVG